MILLLDCHVYLLFIRNVVFAILFAQIIELQAQFPEYSIKTMDLNNVNEFRLQVFVEHCILIGIGIEHSVSHVHAQNDLTRSFI